jgi:prepilin-type N-terminal cleavage/methylation domain-containing protein
VGTQRGFTLVELIVAVGIVALVSICVVTLSLAQRPGALRAATSGFDSSLAAARAIAATSGNGATLVIAPRNDGHGARLPGFSLSVYRGRPTSANAVTPTTVMPLIADADVREATLGAPPFAIFLSSAGHASGLASYPSLDSNGKPQFSIVATQPACPSGGLVLTFTSAHASQTRTLSCRALVLGPPQPIGTMPPAPVVLTPKSLVFFWPSAAQQHFVATEWGYTRWFAGESFACGVGVAQFPQDAPAPPYTAPHSPQDASADPQPPGGVPYSFANAPDSMEDAPAWFYLSPQAAGLCSVTIADAFAQRATLPVEVMGWLTLEYGGNTATSQTAPLVVGAALKNAGDAVSIAVSKTFDGEAIAANVTIDSPCTQYVRAGSAPGVVSGSGSSATQNATVTLSVTQPYSGQSALQCRGTLGDQYGEPAVAFTFAVQPAISRLTVWPVAVMFPAAGQALAAVGAFHACKPDQARAYLDTMFLSPDGSGPTGGTGCLTTTAIVKTSEQGFAGTFRVDGAACAGSNVVTPTTWTPNSNGPGADWLGVVPAGSAGTCSFTIADGASQNAQAANVVAEVVPACSQINQSCTFGQTNTDDSFCDPGGGGAGGSSHSFSALLTSPQPPVVYGTLTTDGDGIWTFTRTAPGPVTINTDAAVSIPHYAGLRNGQFMCAFSVTNQRAVVTY